MDQPDFWLLYREMLRSRLFEGAVASLWHAGLISGEMHMGLGEEAAVAGVVLQLRDGDALALDHRGTPALIMRGVDPVLLLKEFLGRPDGLCSGMGGHMHLYSQQHLAASSGIVGASGPAALGFALAGGHLRPGSLAVAFFGEGATNQGMLMESFNLAVAWRLPVIFICKDNAWSVTTRSESVSGGVLVERARSFGLNTLPVDGCDIEAVWDAAGEAFQRARQGSGPSFIHARVVHLEGHFLGDQLRRLVRSPLRESAGTTAPLLGSIFKPAGAPLRERLHSLADVMSWIDMTRQDMTAAAQQDPLPRARSRLEGEPGLLAALEQAVQAEIDMVIQAAQTPV
jgi:pyruvate dehydrogenase E1 component alpha subunit